MFINISPRIYRPLLFLSVLSTFFTVGLPATRVSSQASIFVDVAGGNYEQIEVVLQAENAPAPGDVAAFTFTAKPLRDAPDLTVTWELPDGGTLLGGPANELLGAVAPGVSVSQTRQVQFADEGVYTVRVMASYHPNRATTLTAVGVLFFTIDADGSLISDADPRALLYQAPRVKPTIDKSGAAVAGTAATWGPNVPQGCFYVTGLLSRGERQPAANPPRYNDVNGSAVSVHNILVEMREEDTFSDDSYGHTVTDANGKFEFRFCDDDGFLNDELELYTRVCSEVWEGPNKIAIIQQPSEEELYCFDSGTLDSEGGTVDFDITAYSINSIEAAIFNIADSVYWAWKFWNNNLGSGSPAFDRTVTINWERGAKATGSFYSNSRNTLVIADDASSTDEWDDSVIIHEWGHFADQQFSCNQNPGGSHTLPGLNTGMNGDKLSWGEGFPDFYQSAARTIMPGSGFTSYYIDVSGPTVDFEVLQGTASDLNEGAVASLLWDFIDGANDGSDTVNHGQARVQKVLTDPGFQGNAQCNMRRFLRVWQDLGFPIDAQTASTVVQNVNITPAFSAARVASAAGAATVATASAQASFTAAPFDYRWWDQVTMVLDNSTSMAAPAGTPKIEAVKALIHEQVNDLSSNPQGTEFNLYTFNASSTLNTTLAEGLFFPAQIDPVLNPLVANGGDSGCPVRALDALTQAVQNKYDGEAWVYTDGDAQPSTSVAYVQQQLNNRLIRGSVVLLGGCSSLPTVQSNVSGAEKNYLGLAADGSQPGGIVPYLLTAIGTGGQFLFVAPDQLANAVDILRAQSSHSSGAGRWSDYVSNDYTYRWDRLASTEYKWITPGAEDFRGQAVENPLEIAGIPPVTVFGTTYNKLHVFGQGYIGMGNLVGLGNSLSRDLNVLFRSDMQWYFDSNPSAANAPDAPNDGYVQAVYYEDIGEWLVITTDGLSPSSLSRIYQVLINKNTGEIRYQYKAVPTDDALHARIGIQEFDFVTSFSHEVAISNNDINGAIPGTGYKLTPAPPQPSKSYTVAVDSQVQSIGFLQTGYSGSLAPMVVQFPDGSVVDCTDAICLSLNSGLVQYVQVDVNGRTGIYTATISGEGTFSFNAMAASPIRPAALGKRTVELVNEHHFQLDLGLTADGNVMSGWLQTGTGARFGSDFSFFDDGAHDDGVAGDGLFGSDGFTPPGQGVAYLWMQGTINGESIARSDSAPFNFQPIDVQPEPAYIQGFLGSSVSVGFSVTNQDSFQRCYYWEVSVPPGWTFIGSSGSPFCVVAGETGHPIAFFNRPLDNQPGGVTSDFNATFFEAEEGRITGGATATVAFFRPLASVEFDNRWSDTYLRPNGSDTVTMTVNLLDDQGQTSGWSGNLGYDLTTTLGTVTAPTGRFENGRMPIVFTAGNETGVAVITFVLEGSVTATTTLQIRNSSATDLDFAATPTDLSDGAETSTLVATVYDAWGTPVANQSVRLSVSDDDNSQGAINGSEVFTGTTDANGQISTTFTKAPSAAGTVAVRAEVLAPDGDGFRVTHEDVEILTLSGDPFSLRLPVISGGAEQSR